MALNNEIDLTVEQLPQNPITLTPIDETDYNNLVDKPKVNGVTLEGDKTSAQLGLASAEQGTKADSAVQPDDLSVYRTAEQQDVIDEGKVTKSGNETITGQKTFTKPLQLSLSLTDPVDIIDVTDTDLHGNMTLSSDYASSGMFTYLVSHNYASNYDATLLLFNNDMGAFALSLTGSGNAENLSLSGADSSTSSTVIPTKGWVNKYKQDTISDLATIRNGAALGATAVQPSQLAAKADTDLSNVTNTGKSTSASWAMPSDTYVDLTLGASGTTYTAPANGCFFLHKAGSGTGQYLTVINLDANFQQIGYDATNGGQLTSIMPARKGERIQIGYSLGGQTQTFRFIYAEGSKSEAN